MRAKVIEIAAIGLLATLGVLGMLVPSRALAWELFRSENADVNEGNRLLAEGDAQGALAAYDRAARTLPGAAGVHLDRGIALLTAGQLDPAREALRLATEPPASPEIRAAAFYDLGLAFYRQADAAANEQNHEEAQRLFREAADAFRSSLRQQPGNRDAGWNLELALRRIQEQEQAQEQQEEQEEQEQQEQEEQEEQEQQQDQEQQDQQGDQSQDQQDQQEDQQEPQDPQEQDQESEQPEEQGSDETEESGEGEEEPQPQDDQGGEPEGEPGEPQEEPEAEGDPEHALPPDGERLLDALEDREESLERSLARSRAAREQRRVLQDW